MPANFTKLVQACALNIEVQPTSENHASQKIAL